MYADKHALVEQVRVAAERVSSEVGEDRTFTTEQADDAICASWEDAEVRHYNRRCGIICWQGVEACSVDHIAQFLALGA